MITTLAYEACNYRGAMQTVEELAQAAAAIEDLQPQVIVEIGCGNGGTLWLWRQLCDRVYGITLPNPNPDYPVPHGAQVHLGDSHDPASRAWLEEVLDGCPIDVLHIDGDHTYEGVRADYEMYSPLVRPGGMILFHDAANTRDPDMGVPEYWSEIGAGGYLITSKRRPLGIGVLMKEK